ncbi:MAG: DNA polymerase I [Candidatus Magasanikbacteria bacterium]|nr:DNA polymerase I [Candidatus Magasanikbacteria bacterium]
MIQPKFVIIDGNAIIHRAYHALPTMSTKDGVMVNAVYGFTSMLFKVLHDLKPTYLAVTFDVSGGSKARLEKFKEYKATRVKADQALYDQIPLTHEVVVALGIPVFEKSGFEADDVIGTLVKQVTRQCHPEHSARPPRLAVGHVGHVGQEGSLSQPPVEIYIVTGDMDTLQLVGDHVKVYTLRKGINDIVIYDTAEVHQRYGFGPEMMVDYKAIRGDASDNIPGVPGIGEKGATELIQKAGSIEDIYKKIGKLKELGIKDGVVKKLIAGRESAFMSKELAAIDCRVPELDFSLEKCRLKEFNREKLLPVFQKFEFVSLLKRLPGGAASIDEAPKGTKAKHHAKSDFTFIEAKTENEIAALVALIQEEGKFLAQAILNGNLFAGQCLGIVVVVDARGFFVPSALAKKFLPIFADKNIQLIGHDLKQLLKILQVHYSVKSVANKLFDCLIASYLLNPGSRATDLPSIILKVLGKEVPAGSGQESLFGADARLVAHELSLLGLAAPILAKELATVDNLGLLETLEMPLLSVLATMENNGVAIDVPMIKKLSKEAAEEVQKLTKKIYALAGSEFNIASPLQLREVLFEKMDIPTIGIKKGKTGLSTSADELEKLRGAHPIVEEILSFRELTKLQNTYLEVLPTLVNKNTGRIHSNFNQAVTATGRLSSSDPNLQNIPIRTELGRGIRKAFMAAKGHQLVVADYSQIELRIVASLAADAKMMAIFDRDEDIHKATAAAIHGVPLSEVTKEMRRSAKEVNFGVLYGMGAHGLAWRADIPHHQAQEFIDKYFSEFSGIKKYITRTLAFTKKEGYCETLFGRRRYLPELNSSNYQARSAAERMAINHPVQGTAADLMKMAMIEVDKTIGEDFSPGEVKMILQVHDELVFEVQDGLEDKVSALVKKIMESAVKLRVPVKVEVGSGTRWGEIK